MANKKNEDVRLFLQRNGINQKDLADHMGITQACVSIWLSKELSIPRKAQIYEAATAAYRKKYNTNQQLTG